MYVPYIHIFLLFTDVSYHSSFPDLAPCPSQCVSWYRLLYEPSPIVLLDLSSYESECLHVVPRLSSGLV